MELNSFLLKELLQNYPFYQGGINEFYRIPQKLYNKNYYFKILHKAWVIKQYDKNAVNSRLYLSHKVQRQLHELGFPVAKLEITKNNKTIVEIKGAFFSIHRWVEGIQFSPVVESQNMISESIISEIATILAKFHELTPNVTLDPVSETDMISTDFLLQKTYRQCQHLQQGKGLRFSRINRLKFKVRKNDFDHWILERFPRFFNVSSRLNGFSGENIINMGDMIFTHNDINWQNIIFNKVDKLSALIDFDNSIVGPQLYEVGAAAIVIGGPNKVNISLFLSTYFESSDSGYNEQAVKLSMIIKCLSSILYSIHMYIDKIVIDHSLLENWCCYLDDCLKLILPDNEDSIETCE